MEVLVCTIKSRIFRFPGRRLVRRGEGVGVGNREVCFRCFRVRECALRVALGLRQGIPDFPGFQGLQGLEFEGLF